jgi:hypothetical protein
VTSPGPAVDAEPEWRLLERLCLGIETSDGRQEWDELIHAGLRWGLVIEGALRHRVLTLLADAVIRTGVSRDLPLRVAEHLRSALALNRYRRVIWYQELDRVFAALRPAGIPAAVRKGGAYESTVYCGDGRRWIGDIDLLVRPRDQQEVSAVLAGLGYQQGLYDEDSDSVIPFQRPDLIKYRLNPDHLPTSSLRTGDPLVPVIEVDCAMSLTWARAPYQVPVDDVLATLEHVEVTAGTTMTITRALPEFQFLDTVLHLFREAWFEWWLDQEQDVDLLKFGDVLRLAAAYRGHLGRGRFRDLVLHYDVAKPTCWVLEHLDRTFGTSLIAEFELAGHTPEVFLASAAASGPDVAAWLGDMRTRLHTADRRSLLA